MINNSEFKYINASTNEEKMDVKEYSNLYFIDASNRSNEKSLEETFKKMKLEYQDSTKSIEMNALEEFKEYVDTYMDLGKEELKEYFKQNHEIEIDSDKKLIIKSFNLNYNPDSKVVRNYSIRGYLLEK